MKRNVFFGNFQRVFMTVAVRFSLFVFSVMPYWAYIQTKVHSLLAQAFHDLTSYANISGGGGAQHILVDDPVASCYDSCRQIQFICVQCDAILGIHTNECPLLAGTSISRSNIVCDSSLIGISNVRRNFTAIEKKNECIQSCVYKNKIKV